MPIIDIANTKTFAQKEITSAQDPAALEALRVKYLGRQGVLAGFFQRLGEIPKQEKPAIGGALNELKNELSALIQERAGQLKKESSLRDALDPALPGAGQELGRLHPITQITNEICDIFAGLGFSVIEGPEIETEDNNFTGLNIPLDHPSRDAFDTFYLKPQATSFKLQANEKDGKKACGLRPEVCSRLLLRSHTSPAQIRIMKSLKPPLAVVVPGKVYRPDATDAAHSFMFHQVEGFLVDKNVRFSDLKGILDIFAKQLFSEEVKTRFRPHFFPFTEPSAEVDVSCMICKPPATSHQPPENKEKKCSVCGGKGWLEILGSGMIHPNVFKHVGYAPKKYTGFAFGMGVERIAMLKYGINDIRMLFENDIRFLRQF